MLFNSLNFAIFLPLVFILYWFATKGNLRLQYILLLVSSYFFYACWDWRFIFLLVFSTLLDYLTGIKVHEAINQRKKLFWLWLSIGINLGFLGVFKYYNFFAASFADGLSLLGFNSNFGTLQIILPVGISFYTFHGLSYVIDIYKNRIKPERNFIDYSLFVSFFPLLVAGPIERATHLLPQILKKRQFDYSKAADGLRQILWGLFKKVVIADNCAEYANTIFNNSADYSGSTLVVGAIFFTFQIYCDFSGYSDIALGSAKIMGFDLMKNFNIPYISKSIKEFWERWHISLSSWFRDYLYIPLGGNRVKKSRWMLNLFIVFLVSGFWHGANWTFIVWGALHGTYLILEILFKPSTDKLIDTTSKFGKFISVIITFHLAMFAWVFFRANSIESATFALKQIFTNLFTSFSLIGTASAPLLICTLFITAALFYIVDFMKENKRMIEVFQSSSYLRHAVYLFLIYSILLFGNTDKTQFIYFQF